MHESDSSKDIKCNTINNEKNHRIFKPKEKPNVQQMGAAPSLKSFRTIENNNSINRSFKANKKNNQNQENNNNFNFINYYNNNTINVEKNNIYN